MNRVEVIAPVVGLLHMRVCVEKDVTDAEVLEVANGENPSGTEHGWSVIREGSPEKGGPVPCSDHPEARLHLMLVC